MLNPITGIRLALLSVSIAMGALLIAIDQFIANVSIPTISGDLGVSTDEGSWIVTSFTVANAMVVPLTGWLTKNIGKVRLFALSTLLFTFFSFVCGISFNLPMLLIARFCQGFSSGCLLPLSQTLLLAIYPTEKKGLAIGLWGLVVMVGPVMGPFLGGWITESYGWGWIFYVNIPFGIFAGVATYLLLRKEKDVVEKTPMDTTGLVLFLLGISSLQILLDRGNDLDWWGSTFIVVLSVISVVCLTLCVVWEWYTAKPVIDLRLFSHRNFSLGCFMGSFGLMIVFATLIVEPLWVQAQLGYTPLWSGLTLAPFGVFAVILFPLLGRYLHFFNLKVLIILSLLLFAATNFWMSNLYLQVPFWAIALPRLFQGAAFALLLVPVTALTLRHLPPEQVASGAGLFSFTRMLFVGIGVSLSVSFWNRRAQFYQSRLAEYAIPSNPYLGEYKAKLAQVGIEGQRATAVVYQEVIDQAYTFSVLDLFYAIGWVCLGLIVVAFFFKTKEERI